MQISNANLIKYTVSSKTVKTEKELELLGSAGNLTVCGNINIIPVDKTEAPTTAQGISNLLNDETFKNTVDEVLPTKTSSTPEIRTMTTSYKDLSEETVANIKQIIYDLHHKSTGTGGNEGGGGSEEIDPPDPTKASFLEDFNDTTSMFEYINSIDSTVTAEKGLTRAQLINLTQRDDWEDGNYDFFGSLNRVFNVIDKDSNGTLSYSEIKEFIGDELGSNVNTYKNKVNTYSNQLQSQYEAMTDQKKLEFVLERTEEYLKATGLTDQLAALNRLKRQQDLHCDVHIGQIGFRDLNEGNTSGYTTLGAYQYKALQFQYEKDGTEYTVGVWVDDQDDERNDLGITLDITLLDKPWYNLVDVLVHELTHATASAWASELYMIDSENIGSRVTTTLIKKLYDTGKISASEYNSYTAKCNAGTLTEAENDYIEYIACSAWGEYEAYQADADYVDSIAGDVYDGRSMTTAVNGPNEKQTIINHINDAYNGQVVEQDDGTSYTYIEPLPNYKWWSYA